METKKRKKWEKNGIGILWKSLPVFLLHSMLFIQNWIEVLHRLKPRLSLSSCILEHLVIFYTYKEKG